ncbi:PREDICTED: uncharacterized protein LOC109352664 [Lupinus angustifolius]|nr:PREDICTED: uncharacterized protein LOC109352664 [Lupinus angustifolius]
MEILDYSCRRLRTKHIPLVKVLWRGQQVEKVTWETEDYIEQHYPELLSRGEMMKKVEENGLVSMDVFGVICEKLDFDDLFQLAGVCKCWRTLHESYWESFMESEVPLLVQTSYGEKACYFISLCQRKIYCSNMMDYARGCSYAGFSCGYVIMAKANNSLLLMNPFTRRKIDLWQPFHSSLVSYPCHAIIAYVKDSTDFIIVLLSERNSSLYIYQTQNCEWNRWYDPCRVVDFVVFQHIVYVITDDAQIGVVILKSNTFKFLQLNNVPSFTSTDLKLVSSDGNLLVVHFVPRHKFEVYKVDFASMDWIKLETLGDVALFYAKNTKCYALSNPVSRGYEKNCLYYIDQSTTLCEVYSMNNYNFPLYISGETVAPSRSRPYWSDWCFRHVRDEVDYSLLE